MPSAPEPQSWLQGPHEKPVGGTTPFKDFCVADTQHLDEVIEAFTSTYVPVQVRVIEPAEPDRVHLRLNALRVSQLTFAYVSFDHEIEITSDGVESYHIDIVLRGGGQVSAGPRGSTPTEIKAGEAIITMPGSHTYARWFRDSELVIVTIPPALLQAELGALLQRAVTEPVVFEPVMDVESRPGRVWLDLVWLMERHAADFGIRYKKTAAAANVERVFADGLLLAQRNNYTEALENPLVVQTPRAVEVAIELIDADPTRSWTVQELASAASVSVRSLQQQFQRSKGLPPLRYLRRVRLQRAHDQLRYANPQVMTVAQVATANGFTDLGRFAAAYREEFHELPSATLRKEWTTPPS